MLTVAWPAILLASIALPPCSCRMVMLARRNECGPKPGKSTGIPCSDFERLPHPRAPHGFRVVLLLKEDPIVGVSDHLRPDPLLEPLHQRAQGQRSLAVLRFGFVHIAMTGPDCRVLVSGNY